MPKFNSRRREPLLHILNCPIGEKEEVQKSILMFDPPRREPFHTISIDYAI